MDQKTSGAVSLFAIGFFVYHFYYILSLKRCCVFSIVYNESRLQMMQVLLVWALTSSINTIELVLEKTFFLKLVTRPTHFVQL